jgi:hypothetical protein
MSGKLNNYPRVLDGDDGLSSSPPPAQIPASAAKSIRSRQAVKRTERKTYQQNWRACNDAQIHEKDKFLELLHDLCTGVNRTGASEDWTTSLRRVCCMLQNLQHAFMPSLHSNFVAKSGALQRALDYHGLDKRHLSD